MVNARKTFDDLDRVPSERWTVPMASHARHRRRRVGWRKLRTAFDTFRRTVARSSCALAAANDSSSKLKRRIIVGRHYLKPGANQNPLAKEFKDVLAKLIGRHWSTVLFGTWFRDNDDL